MKFKEFEFERLADMKNVDICIVFIVMAKLEMNK